RSFLETLGTLFYGKRTSVELIVRVLACLAEGLGIRGTARVFEVAPNTVLQWLVEAAEQLQAFSRHFLHDLHVNQVQLDELFALLSAGSCTSSLRIILLVRESSKMPLLHHRGRGYCHGSTPLLLSAH